MIRDVFGGFRIRIFSHPGSRIHGVKKAPDPGSGSATKNLNTLTHIIVAKLLEISSGLFIADPGSGIFPDTRSRGQKSARSGSATLVFSLPPGIALSLLNFLGSSFTLSDFHYAHTLAASV
jgi:hypothetical protein